MTVRSLRIERLADRCLLVAEFHNIYQPLDVNDDLRVSALDALGIISWLSSDSSEAVDRYTHSQMFPDVNSDGKVTAADALAIINQLRPHASPISVLRLANDTAPGNQRNRDAITSDLTIQGRIASLDPEFYHYALRGIDNIGNEKTVDLKQYLTGNHLEVPGHAVISLFQGVNNRASDETVVELVAHIGDAFGDDAKVLASLPIVLDRVSPQVWLPEIIDSSAYTATIEILDPSEITDSSLATLKIRQPELGNASDGQLRLHSSRVETNKVAIDISLEEWSFESESELLELQIEGTIEDIAGNKTTLPVRRSIERGVALQSTTVAPSELKPDKGNAFNKNVPTLRAGQSVSVFVPKELVKESFTVPVVKRINRESVTTERRRITSDYDERTESLSFYIPNDAVSGDLLNGDGILVFSFNVIPKGDQLPIVNSNRWDLDDYVRSSGGLDVANAQFRYRTFGSDEVIDATTIADVTREDIDDWTLIRNSEVAVFGFATAQLAGSAGVTNPFLVNTLQTGLRDVSAIAITNDESAFWVLSGSSLSQVDYLSGQTITNAAVNRLLENEGPRVSTSPFIARMVDIQIVPSVAFGDRIVFFNPLTSLAPDSLLAARLAIPFQGSQWILLDAKDGSPVGRVTDNVNYVESDYDSQTVYNPERNTWFQLWNDGSRWREISVSLGEIVASGGPPKSLEFGYLRPANSTNAIGFLQSPFRGRVFFDELTRRIRYQQFPLSSISTRPVDYEFDPLLGDFLVSENPLRISISAPVPSQLIRGILQDDWYYSLPVVAPGPGYHNPDDTAIYRGEVLREDSNAPSPVLLGLRSVAKYGTPTNFEQASANPGQLIEVFGENLSSSTKLTFEADQQVLGNLRYVVLHGVEGASLFDVADDGTHAKTYVPWSATTAEVRVAGQANGHFLQIVPRIHPSATIRGDAASQDQFFASYEISGLSSSQFVVRTDGNLLIGCEWISDEDCQPQLNYPQDHRFTQVLEVSTLGGTTRLELPTSRDFDLDWTIQSIQTSQIQLAADYQYVNLAPNEVLAGSVLEVRVNSRSSNVSEPQSRLQLLLRASAGGESNHTITAYLQTNGTYLFDLPLSFAGGTIEILGTEPTAKTQPENRFPLNVAATVVAASGDSLLPGSTVLLAGINLLDAVITIDDILIDAKKVPSFNSSGLQFLALDVPSGVTQGVIRIERNGVTVTRERLTPWWDTNDMPTAKVGTPAFASVPSANDLQTIRFLVDCPDDMMHSGGSRLPSVIYGRTVSRRNLLDGPQFRVTGTLSDNRLVAIAPVPTSDSVYLFGDRSGRSLNLLPIVPRIRGVQVITASSQFSSGIYRVDDETWINFDINIYSQPKVNIRWGAETWSVAHTELYRQRLPGYQPIENAYLYGNTPTSPLNYWGSGDLPSYLYYADSSNHRQSIPLWLLFGQYNRPDLPIGPIEISNEWGQSEWTAPQPEESESPSSSLVAEYGTPANPNFPSVNVGQELAVADSFRNRFDGVFFQRYQSSSVKAPGETVNWTAATGTNHQGNLNIQAKYLVPELARTGSMRWGFMGQESYVQVIPRIYASTYAGILVISMKGLDHGDYLQIGSHVVALSNQEIDQGKFVFWPRDTRLAGLTSDDLKVGFSVVGKGGTSELIQPPLITNILVNGTAVIDGKGPIPVRPRDEITILGSGFTKSVQLELLPNGRFERFYSLPSFRVSPDGSSLQFSLTGQDRAGSIEHLSLRQWALVLDESRLLFVTPE